MLTKEEERLRNVVWHLRNTMSSMIGDAFRHADIRFKPEKAMRVDFRLDGEDACLLLWAPLNYVGAFECRRSREGETAWKCLAYHDSCWANAVHDFIDRNAEQIHCLSLRGLHFPAITPAMQSTLKDAITESTRPHRDKEAKAC